MSSTANNESGFRWFLGQAFGSDELVPYTAEYAWNSNQMAHAMMGFCLAICWLLFVISLRPAPGGPHAAPPAAKNGLARLFAWLQNQPLDLYVVLLFATIPVKELADVLLDRSNYTGSPVSANLPRLLFDSITDISFWWTGMFLAAAMIGWFVDGSRYRGTIATVGLLACIGFWYAYAAPRWLNQKRSFDLSGMPFNYRRLAVQAGRDEIPFAGDARAEWTRLEAFRSGVVDDDSPPHRHYILFGGHPDDRSRLAVGMGCEYAFKLRPEDTKTRDPLDLLHVRYASAADLLELPELLEDVRPGKLECVVIDGLDVSTRRPSDTTPEKILEGFRQTAEDLKLDKVPVAARVLKEQVLENLDAGAARLGPAAARELESAAAEGGAVELSREQIDALAPRSEAPELNASDKRLETIRRLGSLAAKHRISTIWVLGGYAGPKGSRTRDDWEDRRVKWIDEIATILGVRTADLQLIELTDPPAPTGALPNPSANRDAARPTVPAAPSGNGP